MPDDATDEKRYPYRAKPGFARVVDAALSRRGFLKGVIAVGWGAFVSVVVPRMQVAADETGAGQLEFDPVPAGTEDKIILPRGFKYHRVASWGDPLWSDAPPFDSRTRGTAASQARAVGDNNDGMEIFEKDGRVLLAVNNEYFNDEFLFGNRESNKPETRDDIGKGIAAVGVAIFEIKQQGDGEWKIAEDSPFNRRITADTPMDITGPAAGTYLLKTGDDPTGKKARGTLGNCGSGKTPWGTYLTCEENFDYAFALTPEKDKDKLTSDMRRYGVGLNIYSYGWERDPRHRRFDPVREPREANRFGYVVEIDPADPRATPRKHTALGRFKHENAEVVLARDGRVVVYMGDDERGEFLYRFISSGKYVEGGDGRDILSDGELFAAKFHDDGRGEWLPLTPKTTGGMSKEQICVFTREAASKAGATTMDRPEWVAAHPNRAEAYCALTHNAYRGDGANRGGDAMPVGGPNPRAGNRYGQIVRWVPDGSDHGADKFGWNLYVLAGNPAVHRDRYAGSSNVNVANMFNSPDGLAFDTRGGLWIQTDGNFSNAGDFLGQGNNQMLLGNPLTGEIKRFLVGPRGAEITGLCWSPDRKTMFVGVQHPTGHFPDGGGSPPRSTIIAVQREDGQLVG